MNNEKNLRNITLQFGPNIKEIRNKNGMSIREVSKSANVSSSYWSQIENLKREIPQTDVLLKMARSLHISNNKIFHLAGIKRSTDKYLSQPEEFSVIQRGASKLSKSEQEKLIALMKVSFEELNDGAFEEDDGDDDL